MNNQPIYRENGLNGLNWQCCLAGRSKTAPTILIFSIAMGADYSFELISIVHWVPQFIGHNNIFLGSVCIKIKRSNKNKNWTFIQNSNLQLHSNITGWLLRTLHTGWYRPCSSRGGLQFKLFLHCKTCSGKTIEIWNQKRFGWWQIY